MDRCQLCEIEISALLDGESPEEALLPVLDHLVACPACRGFYERARRLDSAVAALGSTDDAAPPPELWRQIAQSSGLAPQRARNRWPTRWSQLAAAVLLALGLWAAAGTTDQRRDRGDRFEVVLGQDKGQMSEARFAQIVVDVLRADRRYHRKMLEVMTAVDELAGDRELRDPIRPVYASQELDNSERRQNGSREGGPRVSETRTF